MALSLYKRLSSGKQLLANIDYDNPDVISILEQVRVKTGLQIDCYGDTVLYKSHLESLRHASQNFLNKKNPSIVNLYNKLCEILESDIPNGVSFLLMGD
ncbi:MAG TPA: hypothetical protein VF690_08405 [Hymenobacter sp.]|jgi:hypothetical protein